MPHEGDKRRNYSMEFKHEATEYGEKNSNHRVAEKFHVPVKRIKEWRQNKLKIFEPTFKPNTRLEGGGRKPLVLQLENQLVEWIYDRSSNGLRFQWKLIMVKAKYFDGNECDESEKSLFVASNRWVNNLMHRNGFSLRSKTKPAQQDPELLIDKLILYILHVCRLSIKYKYPPSSIITMDQTSVWNDMVSNTTIDKQGAKSVCLKTNEHEKCMVSVCLAAKADGTKLKPFVVFRAANRESKSRDKEFKSCCVVKSSTDTWINEKLPSA